MKQFPFSKRFNEIGLGEEENSLTKIKNLKLEKGVTIVDLINSNPTTVGLNFPSNIITHNINQQEIELYAPSAKGLYSARKSISDYYATKGILVHPDDLILTASTSESYSYLFKLLTNPGDEILVPTPGYPLFSFLSQFENLTTIEFEMEEDEKGNWYYSLDKIKDKVTTKTKAIILVSPANPTGSFLSKEDWENWIDWSKKQQIPLIIDEVFSPYFHFDSSAYAYPYSDSAPIFVLNGISKLLALPQWKLGWIHVIGEDRFKKQALSGLELLADTYLSVNAPVQILFPEIIKWSSLIQNQINNRIRRNLTEASSVINENRSLCWRNGKAGWYGWLEIYSNKFATGEEIAELVLNEKNIYLHPGEWYGFDSTRLILILSLIVPEDQFLGGIKELTSFLR